MLTGRDIPSHPADYRTDHIDRYERVRTNADIDVIFVESERAHDDYQLSSSRRKHPLDDAELDTLTDPRSPRALADHARRLNLPTT